MKKERGISLIALIITIIVIIILASIAITSSLKTPQQAGYAKFCNDISTIQEKVAVRYTEVFGEKILAGINVTDKHVYKEFTGVGTATIGGKTVYEINGAKLKHDLPIYTDADGGEKKWYLDIENGTVYLIPGYEYDGQIYTTVTSTEAGESSTGSARKLG